jgi:glucose-6-phosphate 1-dehydrogenase
MDNLDLKWPKKSMIWANSVLPTYIAISGSGKAVRLHDVPFAVQVGDRVKVPEIGIR